MPPQRPLPAAPFDAAGGLPGLVALDLDGTLLTSDKRVGPRARASILRLTQRGVTVVLCTGRPPRSAARFAAELALPHPFVCYNGAAVYDPGSGAVSVRHVLDAPAALEVLERLRGAAPGVLAGLETPTGWYLDAALAALRGSEARLGREPPTAVGPVESFVADGAIKLFFRHAELDAAALAEPLVGLNVYRTWSSRRLLEVMHPGVNKREALVSLCQGLGIERGRVAAFGDQHNDAEMLAWAGVGVAVANASPTARAAAARCTASNDEDGVALVLEAWLAANDARGARG